MTIKRGDDPREFALVVLGGAGPVHGAALAEEIGMPEVIVPEAPGVLAAFGLLSAPVEHHHARTLSGRTDAIDLSAVNACLLALDAAGRSRMREEGVADGAVAVAYRADMRYVGQAYELDVPVPAPLRADALAGVTAAFHAVHERVYGYARPEAAVEFVNFRAVHQAPSPRPVVATERAGAGDLASARIGGRQAWFAACGRVATPVYERGRLPAGARVAGPAIVEQPDTTTVIPPDWAAVVEPSGNLRIRRGRAAGAEP
jgi:N-methylhydantoinase A